ncbi:MULTISPECIES: NADH-quinone oxidoreductase subunit M [Euryhalocaulis]|uniref:NADH-quinone oxidoreductase subunit M n=1 Tax=Euryhalocaulis TaxID=1712422 RepID=UPI00039AF30E|nr:MULTISPECIES: NADH-quinone oxidoreductase subunit M [Euryhalocaulis]MBA4800400.1 NADH-quinone oxidoreductase subunit M [Euryhalocaulis sp.]
MSDFPILSLTTFLPTIGALLILVLKAMARPEDGEVVDRNSRWVALWFTLGALASSLVVLSWFDPSLAGFQLTEEANWLGLDISYRMGVDGISVLFVLLTTFLMPICIIAGWRSINTRITEYLASFLVLETMMIGVFTAKDLILFYFFFEAGLIPMFLLIGIWGGANRVYASYKFFLYTLLGSLLMLVAIIYMYLQAGTTDIAILMDYRFDPGVQKWLWLAFFASFAVKMPMWPVHTWLPDAHVQAPTAGSVILAGVLLKMGGYGFLRFSLPMFPFGSEYFAPLVFALSVIAIIYTSLVAFRQTDIKKLVAYSSVAHMGFVTLGIFAANAQGLQGAIFQMISHGVISGALFLAVGVIYDRMHTREIAFYGGLVHRMPVYAAIFLLFALGNVGLPGTSGFVGEILTMVGGYLVNPWIAFGAAFGVILSAVYMLNVYRNVVFGEIVNSKLENITDVNRRELITFIPLIIATLALGVFPSLVTDITETSVMDLVAHYEEALAPAPETLEIPLEP